MLSTFLFSHQMLLQCMKTDPQSTTRQGFVAATPIEDSLHMSRRNRAQ
jgi:hypothetical protein